MKSNGNYSRKSLTSEYLIAMAELNDLGSEEPEDDLFLPMRTESIYNAKSAIDNVLSHYEMDSTAIDDGIIIHEAKSIGPVLANELIGALLDVSVKQLGPTLAGGGGSAEDEIDRDGDGYIFDGTPQEQRVPYKRRDGKPVGGGAASGMEKRRRQFVRQEAARQGVQLNRERRAGGPGRSESERQFRTEARARFDRIALEGEGFIPADRIEAGDKRNFENRMEDLNKPRRPDPRGDRSFERNEERRQRGLRQPDSWDENEQRRQEGMRPEDTSFQDNESRRQGAMRPGSRPVDRLRGAGGPGYDESFQDNESRRQSGMRPADTSFQDNESRRQGGMRPGSRPVDRLRGAGGPGYDESFQDNESRRQGGMRPADTSSQRAENARLGAARPQRPVDRLTGPGYDESFQDNESRRQGGMRPADTSSQRAESARQGIARPQRPVDRLGAAGGPGYDESSQRAESARQQRMRPADTSSQRAESARQGAARPQRPVDRLAGAGRSGPDGSNETAEQNRMNRSRPEDTSSQRAESSRNNRSRPQGPVDRMGGSTRGVEDGSSNTAERNRMNRSRPADTSSQRNESQRQNRAVRESARGQKRPVDRIRTPSRRFPRGANDYYFGGNPDGGATNLVNP